MVRPIRSRHLKQLLEVSLSLPEPAPAPASKPKRELYGLPFSAWPAPAPREPDESPPTSPPVAERIAARAAVARCLQVMATKLDDALPAALASARQAWDRVDALKVLDGAVTAQVARVRSALHDTITTGEPASRAVALEGLLAVDTAWGLTRLFERRLSSLIRLRVRSGAEELLPDGRPFLDLAAALHEAARAWS